MSRLHSYWSFFSSALQAHFAYAGSLFLSLGATAIGYLVTVMIWNYALPNRVVAHHMFVYLTLGFVLTYMTNFFLEGSIGERIRDGLIAVDLLKPVDFQFFYLVKSLSDVVYNAGLGVIVLGLGLVFLGRDLLPTSPSAAGYAALSVVLAFFVQYGICFVFCQGIFLTHNNYGIIVSRVSLHQAFSGAFAPLSMFPPTFGLIASWLPFQHVIYTPVAIYLGMIQGPGIQTALFQQAAWAVGLLLTGRFIFSRVLAKLSIQGG